MLIDLRKATIYIFDARYKAWLQVNHPEAANKASAFSNLNELGSPYQVHLRNQ